MKRPLSFELNGSRVSALVPTDQFLLETVRDLGLTGTKEGCGEGECGACTVLLDGMPVRACIVFSFCVAGRSVVTIEGLSGGDRLSPVQEAFCEHGAVQCGFCTPGFVVAIEALLDANPEPSEEEIREALAGNLCRCTGYASIVAAAQSAARARAARRAGRERGARPGRRRQATG